MKSSSGIPTPPKASSGAIRLVVKGLGHIPAIKNSMFAIVKKENREWKKKCVQGFVSQLLSTTQTGASATLTLQSLPSLIALLPQDDNWKVISDGVWHCRKVPAGQEGAEITITPLT